MTPLQLEHYRVYEAVRQAGLWNMFDPRARQATGLSKDEYMFVLKNYDALQEAFECEALGKTTP